MQNFRLLAVALVVLSCGAAVAQPSSPRHRSTAPVASYDTALRRGQQLFRDGAYEDAITAFKRALTLKQSAEAYLGLAQSYAYSQYGTAEQIMKSARYGLQLAASDRTAAELHQTLGMGWYALAIDDKPECLEDAIHEFETALMLAPDLDEAHFRLGRALLKAKRDDQGVAELKKYLASHPAKAEFVEQAEQFIGNPRRARDLMPLFTLPTAEGGTISNSALAGKVVVIEFWASWCAFCKYEMPSLRSIVERYPKDRVVVLSISEDDNEDDWREGVAKEQRTWLQALDRKRSLIHILGLHSLPSRVVLDGEGVIRHTQLGIYDLETTEAAVKTLVNGSATAPPKVAGGQ